MKIKYSKIQFLIYLLGFLFIGNSNFAQSNINIDATQAYTNFRFFENADEGTLADSSYIGQVNNSYSIGYLHKFDFGLMVKPSVGMRNTGAGMVYDDMHYAWHLKYLDTKLGVGYILQNRRVSPYLLVSGYYSFLMEGIQTLNNEDFNMPELELIETSDVGLEYAIGGEFKLTSSFALYTQFNYLMGLMDIEPDEIQIAKNNSFSLTLGVNINLSDLYYSE